jgi:uncharacterized protein (TIGR03067 family)
MSNDFTSCPEGIEEELKKFQGTWKQVRYERDGLREPPDEQGWEPLTTFAGKEFVVTLADGSIPIKGTYRLDPTRNPKTVDWTDTIGEDAGKTLLAIYSLNGDRLVFCAAYPGLERPTEFRTRPGQVLRVLQHEAQASNKDEAQCLGEPPNQPLHRMSAPQRLRAVRRPGRDRHR